MTEMLTPAEFRAMLTKAGVKVRVRTGPARYLSRPEVAERVGVAKDTLNRYRLPPPDAQIGVRQVGWLPETIDAWDAARPSRTR